MTSFEADVQKIDPRYDDVTSRSSEGAIHSFIADTLWLSPQALNFK